MEQQIDEPNLFPGYYKPVKYTDLPWEEKATVMWIWYWRAFIISLLTLWMTNFFGGIFLSYVKILVGSLDPIVLQGISVIIGGGIGYLGMHALIQLITRSKIGDYQIVILRKTESQ